jgi:hypothetical protein
LLLVARIDVRVAPNVRLSFNGFKVKTGIGLGQIDGSAVRPKFDKPRVFDNAAKSCSRILVRVWRPTFDNEHHSGCPRSKSSSIQPRRCPRSAPQIVRVFLVPSLKRSLAGIFDYEELWQFGSFGSAKYQRMDCGIGDSRIYHIFVVYRMKAAGIYGEQ